MKTHLILGGPGTGKTHRLMGVVEEEIKGGVPLHSIAFVSFTRQAADVARARAVHAFIRKDGGAPGESRRPLAAIASGSRAISKELPFFRTLHSLCYRHLGIKQSMLFDRTHIRRVGRLLNIPISGFLESEDGDQVMIGDKMLFLENLARATDRPLEAVWTESGSDGIQWYRLLQFAQTVAAYKAEHGLLDFTDMLTRYVAEGAPTGVRVAIVDEAQDLTPVQWQVVARAFDGCERLYIAGDDDQAIYSWSGADVNHFLSIATDTQETLPQSRRVPEKIFELATKVVDRITRRYVKLWKPRDESGAVHRMASLSSADLKSGSWYLLARNRCFLSTLEDECVRQGVPYSRREGPGVREADVKAIQLYEGWRAGANLTNTEQGIVRTALGGPLKERAQSGLWHEAFRGLSPQRVAYYLTMRRSGEKLLSAPRVFIGSIHEVKGGEADNVLLLTDQTARTEAGAARNPDDEARVFYVGITRARHKLIVISPQTNRGYSL